MIQKQKHNSLYSDISNNLKPKVNNIDERVTALEIQVNLNMASLNQLVSEFAHAVGNPNSIPLRRNLRYAILHGRNELIRKSYENHKYG